MINLITDAWLPVVRRSGATDMIRPSELTDGFTDDPITALAFARPDWNGAVTELLIGLHAAALPVPDDEAWFERWEAAPEPGEVAEAMAPFAPAFELMGGGPRAFQDNEVLEGSPNPVQQLLIDAPGGNTAKLNQDLFVRRRGAEHVLSWPDATAALVTLQTYAPSGGAGHRTSMRGGGPLTTLIRPRRGDGVTLFDLIHANAPRGGEKPAPDVRTFPWLGSTRVSPKGEVTTPDDAHSLQAFFGTPRRIRLIGDEAGCAGFVTTPRGVNYEAWAHPLSPYYQVKGAWLPVHPREGQPTFRDWPSYWGAGEGRRAADCVTAFGPMIIEGINADILSFGYDMDNAKARAWQEVRVPLVLNTATRERAGAMVEAAGEAGAALRFAAKRALYGTAREKDGRTEVYLPDTVPKRACAELGSELELTTEARLVALIAFVSGKSTEERDAAFLAWHRELRGTALRLFDRTVGIERVSAGDLSRIVAARGALAAAFSPKGKVAKALGVGERLKAEIEERERARKEAA